MWASIETLRDICKVLEARSLGGYPARARAGRDARDPASPPEDPPMVRRILRQLRQASRATRYLVEMVLAAIEKRRGGQP